ncbi:IclR family transcriptional regulator [Streptomyces sioyaensis]|uniref:IclR family transcriptional regulator n=1 Tax=Streptomyces sioyaensis TaxID=67364 RepID=A0A4Q1QSY0_9ACTN|nr:IclR family transcriptional regulator [Streptomyces sioyaensis]MBM4792344.1 IclR family transcriptional regulator [Streptomyces sioyaensis]RXS65245.1 IclR family transcriptional regulator [Streptomyces sioyaensis]
MSNDSLSSVKRALEVLRALGQGPMRVQAMAHAIGREKTQVSRTLKVLAEEGFAVRDPETMEYRLGWQFFALAAAAEENPLRHEAPRVLRALVQQLGESAHLTTLAGNAAVTVLSERPVRTLQVHERVGQTSPLNCTSCGRALLLGVPDDEVVALFAAADATGEPLPGSERAPRTVPALLERLHEERRAGYVVSIEEHEPGMTAVAAPVRDFRGAPVAAVNISAPTMRLPPEAHPPVIEAVLSACKRLSETLGYANH